MADLESFSDIRSAVTTALQEVDPDNCASVCDLGSDWVVYQDADAKGPGYYRCAYRMDGDKVLLDGKPVQVARRTMYEPVDEKKSAPDEPKNLKQAASKTKQMFAEYRAAKASPA